MITTILARSLFDEIHVKARAHTADRWRAQLKTHGQSDVYVVDNKFAPGGTAGWHSHPGPSLILVVSGTVTNSWAMTLTAHRIPTPQGTASSIRAAGTCTCCATKLAPQRRRSRSSCFPRMPYDGSTYRWHPATARSRVGRRAEGGPVPALQRPPRRTPDVTLMGKRWKGAGDTGGRIVDDTNAATAGRVAHWDRGATLDRTTAMAACCLLPVRAANAS